MASEIMFPIDLQPNSIKNDLYNALKDDSLKSLRRLVNTFKISPLEEISKKGNYWCAIHYCCSFKSLSCLEFLLQYLCATYRETNELLSALNVRTVEMYTPAMVAVVYKADTALELLFKYGGVDLSARNIFDESIFSLARKYQSSKCEDLLEACAIVHSSSQVILPLKQHMLQSLPSLDELSGKEDFEKASILNNSLEEKGNFVAKTDSGELAKQRELLLNGFRMPCTICLGDKGYIMYCRSCGQPYHKKCTSELEKCVHCNCQIISLQSDIVNIEKSFFIL